MLPWYSAPTVIHGIFWMVIGHSGTCYRGTQPPRQCTVFFGWQSATLVHFTAVFSHHGNVWYTLYFIFFGVTPACVWCCDARAFTEHGNHQTSNLDMKYSGDHNKRQCPDHRQAFIRSQQLWVCVFFTFILGVKFVGSTSRDHTGFLIHLPSFCGACLYFSREKDSAVPIPSRP